MVQHSLSPPAPTPANQIVSNQTYQITLGTLFYLCDPWPAVSGGTMVTAAAGHGISLATEESKYKKNKIIIKRSARGHSSSKVP